MSEAKHTPGPWQVSAVGGHFVVSRWYPQGGHDTLRAPGARRFSKFRSSESAQRAADIAQIISAYTHALSVDPESKWGDHAGYYASELVRQLGMTEKAARAAIAKATGTAQ